MAKQKNTESQETKVSSTVIASCSCKHPYQDQKYGHGKRVFNIGQKDKNKFEGTCTVCGKKGQLK